MKNPNWGPYLSLISTAFEKSARNSVIEKIWDKDPLLWKSDPSHHAEIVNRLGWLTLPSAMKKALPDITAFAESVQKEGFAHIALLGMGGSSLAPEVVQTVFGPKPGFPTLVVLDSTDPEQVAAIEKSIDLNKTLFIVSSKSGGTIELVSFFKYFYAKLKAIKGEAAGSHFIAITDPGSPLEGEAKKYGFRKIFLAPPDVGGRFSALTVFGLVPAALIGVNLKRVLSAAADMMKACGREEALIDDPAAALGIGMGALALEGRDKLTLLTSKSLESFGDWAEQLVAESTGKEGKGIVPVVRESLGEAADYGKDRFFVALLREAEKNTEIEKRLTELQKAGHPTLVLKLRDIHDLGAEFYRWEMATAMACAILGVNPFDQPDVQSAKTQTGAILKGAASGQTIAVKKSELTGEAFWKSLKKNDYVGILSFLPYRAELRKRLEEFQAEVRERTLAPVTLGFGPRYLHSTGQLHKGGANNGLFIIVSAPHVHDLPVPGEAYTFQTLELAQAMGDLEALTGKGRRLVHVRLPELSARALDKALTELVSDIPRPAGR